MTDLKELEEFREAVMTLLDSSAGPLVGWDKDGDKAKNDKAALDAIVRISEDLKTYRSAYYKKIKTDRRTK